MRSAFVHAIVILQVVMQALIGIAPGRVVCLPVAPCGAEHGCDSTSSDSDACCPPTAARPRDCHEHRPSPLHLTPDDAGRCGCHLHVLVPDDPQWSAARGGRIDMLAPGDAVLVPPSLLALDIPMIAAPPSPPSRPPDGADPDGVAALRSIRLRL